MSPVRFAFPALLLAGLLPVASGGTAAAGADGPPPLERFRAMVERPLFRPDRRPVETFVEEEEERPLEIPFDPGAELDLRFVGTLVEGGRAVALVELDGEPELVRLSVGDRIGEWRVVIVDDDRLVLSDGSERRRYTLLE